MHGACGAVDGAARLQVPLGVYIEGNQNTLPRIRNQKHPSARWQSMARKKMSELDVLAARVVRMRQALELGLKCGCVRIEDCTLSPADVPPMKDQQIKATGGCEC